MPAAEEVAVGGEALPLGAGRATKRRMSWADDVQDPSRASKLTATEEPQTVRMGILRIGNVYRSSVELPTPAQTAEVLPFLSPALSVDLGPAADASRASLVLTYSAQREGRFADCVTVRIAADGASAGPSAAPVELRVRVEGAVMGRDAGKPLPRRGVELVSEGCPEDFDTEAGTAWGGFGAAAAGTTAESASESEEEGRGVEAAPTPGAG
uniref:Uncharacterized protein n=1 Tax=Alexandrium monilatum TaxID=311494 RepID=A0A7S4PX60_9DINO|mmetsp:Transcript_2076/g.6768  ORF Transcript_2076/g.6768 Transcript_2076/m.6768 type:complete len:211 (-) Transcript_2076:44-676(-)